MQIQLIRRRRGTSTPSPPAFSPDDLAGLVHWLDATAITGASDGARFLSWPDLSPSGLDATAAGNGPFYRAGKLNGLPGVHYDGSAKSVTTAPPTTAVDGFTQIVLAELASGILANAVPVYVGAHGADGWGAALVINDGTQAGWLRGGIAWQGFTPAATGPQVLIGRRQAGTFTFRVNGGPSLGSTTDAPTAPTVCLRVGSMGDAGMVPCYVYESLVYNAAVPNADLNQIGAYLAAKWAVPWSPVS
jgi:hypothetical protein